MNLPARPQKKSPERFGQNFKRQLFGFVFRSPSSGVGSRMADYCLLGIAYLAGVFHWAWILNYGRVDYKFFDWQKFFDYYGVLKKALMENSIPWFMPHYYKGTNQFLAIPETDLSPTTFLLKFLSVDEFFLAQSLILYSLGFVGSLMIRKKYQWSLFAFLCFFLIFNFNGHIVSHLTFGHWPWISYFLFPFYLLWTLRLVEGDCSPAHGARLAVLMSGILLLGGLHTFFWCLFFLGLVCLFQKKFFKPVLIGTGLCVAISSYRIIPAMFTYFGYKNKFAFGFPSIPEFFESMILIREFKTVLGPVLDKIGYYGWWEINHYIGVLGLGFVLYFGINLRRLQEEKWEGQDYRILDGPMVIMTILSFSFIYGLITLLPIPLITVERISSRFFIIPLLILMTLACMGMQQRFERESETWSLMGLALAGLLFEGLMLLSHSFAWQVRSLQFEMEKEGIRAVDPVSEWARSMEAYYVPVVQGSYLISALALAGFLGTVLYLKFKPKISAKA